MIFFQFLFSKLFNPLHKFFVLLLIFRLKETALVPGCEETELAKLLTVDSCKRQFTLGAITGTPAQVPYFRE